MQLIRRNLRYKEIGKWMEEKKIRVFTYIILAYHLLQLIHPSVGLASVLLSEAISHPIQI